MKEELTLGELVKKLDQLVKDFPEESDDPIYFDFGSAYPTRFCSYRGYYNELSLEFSGEYNNRESIKTFLEKCTNTIGETFNGWKGGGFEMDKSSPIWVACEGVTSSTKIYDVVKDDIYGFKILTMQVND